MGTSNYISFKIEGIKKFGFEDSISINIENEYISEIVVYEDVSKVIFYVHDYIKNLEHDAQKIENYLVDYLSNMMIGLLKKSTSYPNASLHPVFYVTERCLGASRKTVNDEIKLEDSIDLCPKFCGTDLVEQWIKCVDVDDYNRKTDDFNILFLLLQGNNIVQKYLAMYAFLMLLVSNINNSKKENQKQVVDYISKTCPKVGIPLNLSHSTRPGAKNGEKEDQFTALRNRIAHPQINKGEERVCNSSINNLSILICYAIDEKFSYSSK
jgi:hypothetical protein